MKLTINKLKLYFYVNEKIMYKHVFKQDSCIPNKNKLWFKKSHDVDKDILLVLFCILVIQIFHCSLLFFNNTIMLANY